MSEKNSYINVEFERPFRNLSINVKVPQGYFDYAYNEMNLPIHKIKEILHDIGIEGLRDIVDNIRKIKETTEES